MFSLAMFKLSVRLQCGGVFNFSQAAGRNQREDRHQVSEETQETRVLFFQKFIL